MTTARPGSTDTSPLPPRRLPIGAEPLADGGVHFRVWAPRRTAVSVVLERGPGAPDEVALTAEGDGYFAGTVPTAATGSCYKYKLDDGGAFPDPASRFQPDGVHGASEVIDPTTFRWTDGDWRGLALRGQVIYELHVGTFTRDGTWDAARQHLVELAALGVTTIEVMPVAEFPGRFGWGYDGVDLYAPTRLYGRPDDFRRFVDEAHAAGLGVILDVVYNHLGPDGCYHREFAPQYFAADGKNEWGDALNFDGEGATPVREFFVANAGYWIDEFHLDGLRLDATQSIHDASPRHVLVEIGERVRAAARGRGTITVNENEPQHARLVRPVERGGYGLDMIWNDDWHHSAIVAVTGQDSAYYTDYRGTAQEFVSAAKYGFLFQGQWYRWQFGRRGTPTLDVEPARFVHFLQNHDQVANAGRGDRPDRMTSPGRWRAMTALLLLGPQTPMLFQGQEFAASSPFVYFADHEPELARLVSKGRREFMAQFENMARPDTQAMLPEPHDLSAFERCKLDHAERDERGHREALLMHGDLLRLRRDDPAFAAQRRVDGAVLGTDCFVLRFFADDGDDRLLVVNLARTLHFDPAPEPLLAPPEGTRWRIAWSSQDARYGGVGTLDPDAPQIDRSVPNRDEPRPRENWRLQGETALVLVPEPAERFS